MTWNLGFVISGTYYCIIWY